MVWQFILRLSQDRSILKGVNRMTPMRGPAMTEPRLPLTRDAAQASLADSLRRGEHLRALRSPHRLAASPEPIAVRLLGEADRAPIELLAARDSSPPPRGELLGAEVAGALVAALSLDDGGLIADPFRPSRSAVELLRLRAAQLEAGERRGRLRPALRRRFRRRSRAALASSPPGAGGRLLQL